MRTQANGTLVMTPRRRISRIGHALLVLLMLAAFPVVGSGTAAAACFGGAPSGSCRADAGEQCDDGNLVNIGDGCTNACTIEAGFSCTCVAGSASVCTSFTRT